MECNWQKNKLKLIMIPIHLREQYWGIRCPEELITPSYHLQPSIEDLVTGRKGASELIVYYTRKVCGSPQGKLTVTLPQTYNWEIVCLSKEVTADQAAEIIGVSKKSVMDEDIVAFYFLLEVNKLDPANTLILKKL